jgi:hypothetical protein
MNRPGQTKIVEDVELDLLTPNERIQRGKAHRRVMFWSTPRSPLKTPQLDGKKGDEQRKWVQAYKRAAAEMIRQENFGRYNGGNCMPTCLSCCKFFVLRCFVESISFETSFTSASK